MVVDSKEWAITLLNNIVFLFFENFVRYNLIIVIPFLLLTPSRSLSYSQPFPTPHFLNTQSNSQSPFVLGMGLSTGAWGDPTRDKKQTNNRSSSKGHQLLVAPQLGMGVLEPLLPLCCSAAWRHLIQTTQPPWVHEYSGHGMFRRPFFPDPPCPLAFVTFLPSLLQGCLSWAGGGEQGNRGSDSDVPFVTEHSTDT